MRRETQNILLVLLGGALLKISLNGTYLRYVKPAQLPWLIAAGVIMLVVAFVSIGRDIIATRRPAEVSDEGHGHAHGHAHRGSYSTWLLLLPVLALFLIAPPALGEDSVNRSSTRTPPPTSSEEFGFPALPAGDVIDQSMRDFVERAAWDKSGSLNNRSVRVTGFVVHKDADTYLARMTISCCAADAYPVKVKLTGPGGFESLPSDTWVQATVAYQPGTSTKETRYIPTVTVKDLKPTAEPQDPYEY